VIGRAGLAGSLSEPEGGLTLMPEHEKDYLKKISL